MYLQVSAAVSSARPTKTSRWLNLQPARHRRWASGGLRACLPPILLAAATFGFCWRLLAAGLVVIGYDTMTYMYPYRYFAAQALQDGRLPLWNPLIYYGAPFLANMQSAVFYPLHAVFLLLPAPQAMNWSVAGHLFLCAYLGYLAARHVAGLDRVGATVAGAAYGLSGFVGAQVGHLNQLNAAAWLPAALLAFHLAVTQRSLRWVALTAIALGVQLLAGHAQESFMTVVLLGAYGVFLGVRGIASEVAKVTHRDGEPPVPSSTPDDVDGAMPSPVAASNGSAAFFGRGGDVARRRQINAAVWAAVMQLGWIVGALGVAGGLAGGLAAAQLLPTNELTALSIRARGMTYWEASSFSLPPRELFVGLLPTFGQASPTSNEYIGWIGFSGMTLAALAVLFRTQQAGTLFFAIVGVVSFLLALGNHFPLYELIFHVPGFNLFRVPARWLLLCSFSGAMLAGGGLTFLGHLGRRGWLSEPTYPGPWQRLMGAARLLVGVAVIGLTALLLWPNQVSSTGPVPAQLVTIWLASASVCVVLAFWSLAAAPSRWPPLAFGALLLAELFMASRSLEYNNPNPETVYTASRPVIDALKRQPEPGRVLSIAATGYHPSDASTLVEPFQQLLGTRGVLATLINTKYKEILNPNLSMVFDIPTIDGYDGGVLPLQRYVDFKGVLVAPERNLPDSLLRDQVPQIPSLHLLQTLGIKYLITDAIGDATVDGVPYDLLANLTLGGGERRDLSLGEPQVGFRPANGGTVQAVGVVSALEGAGGLPDGTPVLEITIYGTGSEVWSGVLRAGDDTAEAGYGPGMRHRQPAPLGVPGAAAGSSGAPGGARYLSRLEVTGIRTPRRVTVRNLLAGANVRVRLHGVTVIGERVPGETGAGSGSAPALHWPVAVTGEEALRLIHRSDVKLYQVTTPLPRVYLTGSATVVDDARAGLAELKRPELHPQQTVVLEADRGPPPTSASALRGLGRTVRDETKRWLGILVDARAGTVPAERRESLHRIGASTAPVPSAMPEGGVTLVQDEAETVRLEVDTPRPSLLVLRDTWYPGWTASVDGAATPIFRADLLFRAIEVPAGKHVIEFHYRSRALESGALLSIAALVALVVLLALGGSGALGRLGHRLRPAR